MRQVKQQLSNSQSLHFHLKYFSSTLTWLKWLSEMSERVSSDLYSRSVSLKIIVQVKNSNEKSSVHILYSMLHVPFNFGFYFYLVDIFYIFDSTWEQISVCAQPVEKINGLKLSEHTLWMKKISYSIIFNGIL